jgi:hypothetical protein
MDLQGSKLKQEKYMPSFGGCTYVCLLQKTRASEGSISNFFWLVFVRQKQRYFVSGRAWLVSHPAWESKHYIKVCHCLLIECTDR